jgi:type III pantothenate kinase
MSRPSRAAVTEWLFDLGNTRLKFAPLQADGTPGEVLAHAHEGTEGSVRAIDLPSGDVAHVASVASSAATTALLDRLTQCFARMQVPRTLARCGELRIAYAEPARLGVDRFLAMLAARARTQAPFVVVAVGTALTLDLVDGEGRHRGGRIAPSPALMREALHARAAQLPREGGAYAEFAADTDDALASGCEGAALALIERSLTQAQALLGGTPALLLHGGGAPDLLARLPQAEAVPALILEGLARWARIGA